MYNVFGLYMDLFPNECNQQRQGIAKPLHTAILKTRTESQEKPNIYSKPAAMRRRVGSSKDVIHKHRSPTPDSGLRSYSSATSISCNVFFIIEARNLNPSKSMCPGDVDREVICTRSDMKIPGIRCDKVRTYQQKVRNPHPFVVVLELLHPSRFAFWTSSFGNPPVPVAQATPLRPPSSNPPMFFLRK